MLSTRVNCSIGEASQSGTFRRSSSSHTAPVLSLGARQSPRGESEPPEPTLGEFGMAVRLNWLMRKKRSRKTPSQCLISAREYFSPHACSARNATLLGR